MSVRAAETERRRRRRAERLAKSEREWVLGHPDDEYRGEEGRTVSFAADTMRLAEHFAAGCLLRHSARTAMVMGAYGLLIGEGDDDGRHRQPCGCWRCVGG